MLKNILKLVILFFCFIGLYQAYVGCQYQMTMSKSEKAESTRQYDEDLLYYKGGGEPVFMVNKTYKATLIFMEGFRAQAPAGMYADWLKELHEKYKINIIVPVYGLQSWPFKQRNRDWYYQEDMRAVLQIYDAYCSNLPEDHRVVTASMSFGTMPHFAIAAFAKRPPDKMILMSPLNKGLEFKAAGQVVYWLSKQTSWLQYVVLFTAPATPPGRASVWDIVNNEKNLFESGRNVLNPEDSSRYGYLVEKAAGYLEDSLTPKVKGRDILIVWGDSDLFFSQTGFQNLADKLTTSGNTIETMPIKESGHMVLMDNGETLLKERIISILTK